MTSDKRQGWPSGFEAINQEAYRGYLKVISTLQKESTLFGYEQLQTPRVVDLSWVATKNAGSQEIKNEMFALTRVGQNEAGSLVLAFEHTLSLAKYLAFLGQQAEYPFRRLEVGPVYRGERAQKGRKREFMQADIDVVGLKEPWGEVEVLTIMARMLDSLALPVETKIQLNDRRLLVKLISIIEQNSNPDFLKSIMRQIDKLDKESVEKIVEETAAKGLPTKAILEMVRLAQTISTVTDPVEAVALFSKELTKNGWYESEVEMVLETMSKELDLLGKSKERILFNPCLTRGLDYYTGSVFEIRDPRIAYSLCGGGRYDNLIEDIGGPKGMAAIGFAFGVDRMVLAMEKLGVSFDKDKKKGIALITMGENTERYMMEVAGRIRAIGIPAVLIDPDSPKLKNQLSRAATQGYSYCIIVGDDEIKARSISLKNMVTREQSSFPIEQLEHILVASAN